MIELKNVTYEVIENGIKKTILNNVSYIFKNSVTTAITGHNGSGKSTLTKLIIGILKPTKGKIFFNGKDITNLSIDERANLGINYAFQQPVCFKGITIKDLIDMATKETNSVSKACNYLSKVGICAKEYINRDFDETLSGGEQKRIELALALAKKGNCYIFDEPEAGIDLWSFERINSILEKDKTNIVVSHQEKLLKNADEILVLKQGKIECCGKAVDVLKKISNLTCGRIDEGGKNGVR